MIWDITVEEARVKGWLDGPFTAPQITDQLGPTWVPMRRFGVLQGGKLRPIDDGSEFMQNATVIAPERVDLGGFEEYVSLAKEWCRCITPDRHVCVTLPGGKVLHGRLHKEWSVDGARSLMGRTADLRSAYKQIAVHPDHRRYAVVSVIGPDGKAAFFIS